MHWKAVPLFVLEMLVLLVFIGHIAYIPPNYSTLHPFEVLAPLMLLLVYLRLWGLTITRHEWRSDAQKKAKRDA